MNTKSLLVNILLQLLYKTDVTTVKCKYQWVTGEQLMPPTQRENQPGN